MAIRKRKKINFKRISRSINSSYRLFMMPLDEFHKMLDTEAAYLNVEAEDIVKKEPGSIVGETIVLVSCEEDGQYYGFRLEILLYKDIKTYRMETEAEAKRREARAQKAKETKEKKRQLLEEKERKVFEKLREKYG